MDDSRWYILQVKPGSEAAVALQTGVPAYVPRQRVRAFNRKYRKVVSFLTTLIPGVVFVKLRAPSDLKLFMPSKVLGFLRNGDRTPAVLHPKAFVALQAVEREATKQPEPRVEPTRRTIKVGEVVGVYMALFADAVKAFVEEIKGNQIILRVIGSNLRVETTVGKLVA